MEVCISAVRGGERGRHDAGVTYWFSFGFDLDWLSKTFGIGDLGAYGHSVGVISHLCTVGDLGLHGLRVCVEGIAIYLALLGLLLLLCSAQFYCFFAVDLDLTWGENGACVEVHVQTRRTSAIVYHLWLLKSISGSLISRAVSSLDA